MDKKPEKNNVLRTQITDDDANKFESDIRNLGLQLNQRNSELVKKTLTLIRDGKHPKELQEAITSLTFTFMLDGGALLSSIPNNDDSKYGILNIRKRLIEENDCKTAAELMLVDQIASAYWRLMKYERFANQVPGKDDGWSFDQLKVNILKEVRKQIEQAQRQITMNLTLLKDLKQPPLKVNLRTESAYFAQNQQVINENQKNISENR